MDKKGRTIYCLQETQFIFRNINGLQLQEWKKKCHANNNLKDPVLKAQYILIPEKVDYFFKSIREK